MVGVFGGIEEGDGERAEQEGYSEGVEQRSLCCQIDFWFCFFCLFNNERCQVKSCSDNSSRFERTNLGLAVSEAEHVQQKQKQQDMVQRFFLTFYKCPIKVVKLTLHQALQLLAGLRRRT